jgi:hypothetical protein
MFIITIPPTTSEMLVIGTTTAATSDSRLSIKPRIASGVMKSKRSSSPGF